MSSLVRSTNHNAKEPIVLEGHTGPVLSAKFSADGSKIASAGMDKTIQLWNTDDIGDEVNYGEITGHKAAVTSIKWVSDELLVSGSADSTVGFWDTFTGKRTRKCLGHTSIINQVATTSMISASCGDDGYVYVWDPREKGPVDKIKTDNPLLTLTYNHAGDTLFIGGIDPTIQAYDVRSLNQELWSFTESDSTTSLCINKDDSILISRSMNGSLTSYSARAFIPEGISRKAANYFGAPSGKEFQLIRTAFNNNSTSIATGSEDKTLTTFDFVSKKVKIKYTGHNGTVLDVDYHPSEEVLLSTSTDGTIIIRPA